jgi:misacylated tRNA(Ala) deacylase
MAQSLATRYPYVLEFEAVVTHINDDGSIELDKTYFYPTSGGQPNDTGIIRRNDEQFLVKDVRKRDNQVIHIVDKPGLVEGDAVQCSIDKERRMRHMRMHTAAHVLCVILEKAEGAKVTGNQIGADRTRIDFDIEEFDPAKMQRYIEEANRVTAAGHVVRKYFTTRDELIKNPQLVKLAMGFPESVTDVHMVEIAEFDLQPCGGTHVDNTSEIGAIAFEKAESKGKSNRRVYFRLA